MLFGKKIHVSCKSQEKLLVSNFVPPFLSSTHFLGLGHLPLRQYLTFYNPRNFANTNDYYLLPILIRPPNGDAAALCIFQISFKRLVFKFRRRKIGARKRANFLLSSLLISNITYPQAWDPHVCERRTS